MSNDKCRFCNKAKNHDVKDGICLNENGDDGLPVMCVRKWSEDKHFYIDNYLRIFFNAMNKKWCGNLNYIDLFCGPGKSRVKESNNEFNGSPLIALKYHFKQYIFVDKNEKNIDILRTRTKSMDDFGRIRFIKDDCNEKVDEINKSISQKCLSVVLIDPFGINFNFDSYRILTKDKKMDLIIIFPLGMTIKRIMNKSEKEKKMVDNFLGGDGWREMIKYEPKNSYGRIIINYFKSNLEKLGYMVPKEFVLNDITVKNTKNAPIYNLLFASKHPLGNSFWNKITQQNPSGQLSILNQ